MSVILVGSDKTKSQLNDIDETQYLHIESFRPLALPEPALMTDLSMLTTTDFEGDLFDGIGVAVHDIDERCKKLKFARRLFVLTNAASQYNTDRMEGLVTRLTANDYAVNIIGYGFSSVDSATPVAADADSADAAAAAAAAEQQWVDDVISGAAETTAPGDEPRGALRRENEVLLRRFSNRVHGQVLEGSVAQVALQSMLRKAVKQVSKMRGHLNFGTALTGRIAVHAFSQTAVAKEMTRKKLSTLAALDSNSNADTDGDGNGSIAAALAAAAAAEDGEEPDVQLRAPAGAEGEVALVRKYYKSAASLADGTAADATAAAGAAGAGAGPRVKPEPGQRRMADEEEEEEEAKEQAGAQVGRQEGEVNAYGEVEVPLTSLVEGYRYGTDIVSLEPDLVAALKPATTRELTVLHSVKRYNVPPSLFLSGVDFVVAEPSNTGALLAINALVRALEATDSVLLCRYVKRDRGSLEYGALFPHLGVDDTCGFYYVRLPFDEDTRPYRFAAFSSTPALVPDQNELDAAERLIDAMSLVELDEAGAVAAERFDPIATPNPSIARLYAAIAARALDEHAPIEPCAADDPVAAALAPDPEIEQRAAAAQAAFLRTFAVRREAAVDAKGRYRKGAVAWSDVQASAMEQAAAAEAGVKAEFALKGGLPGADGLGLGKDLSLGGLGGLAAGNVTRVGTGDPAGDLAALLHRAKLVHAGDAAMRDAAVDAALAEAAGVVAALAEQSVGDALFPKAVDTCAALRAAALEQGRGAGVYNELATRVFRLAARDQTRFGALWEMFRHRGRAVMPISTTESAASTLSPEAAEEFMADGARAVVEQQPVAQEEPAPAPAPQDDEFDDLV